MTKDAARIGLACAVLALLGGAWTGWALPGEGVSVGPAQAAFQARLAARAPLLGIARAGARLVAVGDYGVVVLSDDNGQSWRQASSVATRTMLTAVVFVNAQAGWAVGHGGVVLQTADGGETWTLNYSAGPDVVLLSVWFEQENRGFAVGAFGFAMATNDGGRTWKQVVVGEGDDRDRHLNAIFALPGGGLFIAAEAGTLFRSDDAGKTWATLRLPYSGSLWGGLALSGGNALVYGMRGHALRSPDRGRSWVDVPTGSDQSWSGGLQLADGRIVLVGLGGAIATSSDSGQSFTSAIRPERQAQASVAEGTRGQLVIAGATGVATYSPAAR